jgi:hypothetical protein
LVPASLNITGSDAVAVGVLVVRNDVRTDTEAYISNLDINSIEDIILCAYENSEIQAKIVSVAEASGGSALGEGTVWAVNGTIATNQVLSKANAYIVDSSVTNTTGTTNITLTAENNTLIDATVLSATMSGDTAIGVTLAFNKVGWEPQNLLFDTIDALITTDIGNEKPVEVQAYIKDTNIEILGELSLSAVSNAMANATLSNAVSSAASALYDANGKSGSFMLASNMVSSFAKAYIDYSNTGTVITGGALSIVAEDNAVIYSNAKLVSSSITTNDGGLSLISNSVTDLVDVISVDHVSGETSVLLEFGDRVRLAEDYDTENGKPGGIYKYLGADLSTPQNLSTTNYLDLGYWIEVPETNLVPTGLNFSDSNSNALGALVVRNDVRSDVEAYIQYASVTSDSINMTAIESAAISAISDSTAESSGGNSIGGTGDSLAASGTIATNLVLSSALAFIKDCSIKTNTGDLVMSAANSSSINAETLTMASSGANAFGLILAFNTVGWKAQNVLFNTVDALLGDPLIASSLGNEDPSRVEVFILDSSLDVAGYLTLTAISNASITSNVGNNATSAPTALFGAGGTSVGIILASNMVSSYAKAYIDIPEITYTSDQTVVALIPGFVVQIKTNITFDENTTFSAGDVYEYIGAELYSVPLGSNTIELAAQNYGNSQNWRKISHLSSIVTGGNISMLAQDDAAIHAETQMLASVEPSNDAGMGIINNLANTWLESYEYTSNSGNRLMDFGTMVRVADDYANTKAEPGTIYQFMGATPISFDLGTTDYLDYAYWKPLSQYTLISDSVIYTALEEIGQKYKKEGLNGSAKVIYGLIDRNDVRSEVLAYINELMISISNSLVLDLFI